MMSCFKRCSEGLVLVVLALISELPLNWMYGGKGLRKHEPMTSKEA